VAPQLLVRMRGAADGLYLQHMIFCAPLLPRCGKIKLSSYI
jgi:hypothetical protein